MYFNGKGNKSSDIYNYKYFRYLHVHVHEYIHVSHAIIRYFTDIPIKLEGRGWLRETRWL